MFNFICKRFPLGARISPIHKLYFIQLNPLSSATLEPLDDEPPSFTVSYLINKYGFSTERAISASKYINFEKPDKPELVWKFFKQHGFTKTQILSLVRRSPPVLLCDPVKTLLPKLEFLTSKGISTADIAKIVSVTPAILKRSLENQITPTFDYLKSVLKSEEKAICAIKRFGTLLVCDPHTSVAANLDVLRELGVPESNIVVFLKKQPRAFMTNLGKFKETVEEVRRIGFSPSRLNFLLAIQAFQSMSKITWKKKLEAYQKWGWSEEDVLLAFGKCPRCMIASEGKIEKTMNFIVNEMGWDSSVLAKRPVLMTLSLEKRIIPRCWVYQLLLSKGLIEKDISVNVLLGSPENVFLDKFVKPFEEKAPELLKSYQAMLALAK